MRPTPAPSRTSPPRRRAATAERSRIPATRAAGGAHPPSSRFVTPGTSAPAANDAPIADVGRLDSLLAILHARGRFAAPLPVYDTEYGYESKEDDPYSPFTRLQQAQFMGWS